jgi:hypothetical protein
MAQRHKWSRGAEAGWCTRIGCNRRREKTMSSPTGWMFSDQGLEPSEKAGMCHGTNKPVEKPETQKHQWAEGHPAYWRPCLRAGCRWQYNAREKKPYRVQGAARLGNLAKAAPCKGAASAPAQREHDWGGSFDELGYQHCMQPGCFVMRRDDKYRTATNPRMTAKPKPCGVAP